MQVIGAGFGRTGTMSLKVALEELGAGPCLHSLQSLSDETGGGALAGLDGVSLHWRRLAEGERVDWRQETAGWGSMLDWVGARCYQEMLEAWPEAKVILSIRDAEDWYQSFEATLHASVQLAGEGDGGLPEALRAIESVIFQDMFGGRFGDRAHAIAVFEAHREQVIAAVPADQLLIYDVREGWEPLCRLLEAPVPDAPFPHLNARASFWTRLRIQRREPSEPAVTASSGLLGTTGTLSSNPAANAPAPGAQAPQRLQHHARESVLPAASAGSPVRIAGIALAEPPRTYTQEQALELLGLQQDEFARRIFGRCGVQRRQLDLSPEWLRTTLQGRTHEVEERLLEYSLRAIAELAIDPSEIGVLVTATLYSLGCPTLAHRLIEELGIDPATDKYHVVGVGCASAIPLIRLASQGLAADPRRKALIVGADSMSGMLMGATDEDPKVKTVGSSIFGDGCAALLLDAGEAAHGPEVLASQVHQIADTLQAVRLDFAPVDSYLGLSRDLPDVAGAHLHGLVDRFLAANGLTGHMVDHWLIHPGGRRIIESAQEALGLSDEQVAVSVEVLANHGNVGTPSIFYVLAKAIARRAPEPGEIGLAITIGPGVTVGLMLLRW